MEPMDCYRDVRLESSRSRWLLTLLASGLSPRKWPLETELHSFVHRGMGNLRTTAIPRAPSLAPGGICLISEAHVLPVLPGMLFNSWAIPNPSTLWIGLGVWTGSCGFTGKRSTKPIQGYKGQAGLSLNKARVGLQQLGIRLYILLGGSQPSP